MKKNSTILAFVAILVLVAMSCSLQVSPSNGPQPQVPPQNPQPMGPQPGGPQPQNPQPGGPQPGGPQPQNPQPGEQPQPTFQPVQPGPQPTTSGSVSGGCAGAPVIPFFNASSTSITSGQSVTLSWGNVTNGTTGPLVGSTKIDPGLGEVGSGASSRTVKPSTTTTYTLTATGCGGTKTKQVTITVSNPTATFIMLQAVVMNLDLAVSKIYPASNGHIMVTLKNAGNVKISGSYKVSCSGNYTDTSNHLLPLSGQYATVNLTAGQTADFDTSYSRNPTIKEMWVECTVTPPSGDSNSSNNSLASKVKG